MSVPRKKHEKLRTTKDQPVKTRMITSIVADDIIQVVGIPSRIHVAAIPKLSFFPFFVVAIVSARIRPFVREGLIRVVVREKIRLIVEAHERFPEHATERQQSAALLHVEDDAAAAAVYSSQLLHARLVAPKQSQHPLDILCDRLLSPNMADLNQGRRFRKVDVPVPEVAEGDSGQDHVSCG